MDGTVTITGLHFANTKAVLFHGTSASSFTPNADGTQITTRIPKDATSGVITVTTSRGSSNSPTAFTVVGPEPFITDFFPVSGMAGTKVLIRGMHFTGASRVTFNGLPGGGLSVSSDILIQVAVPTGVTTGPVGVYTPRGSAVTSSNFLSRPQITSFSPGAGAPGDQVQLAGTGFASGNQAVRFWNGAGGVLARIVIVNSDTLMTVTVPGGISTGPISIQRGNSSATYSVQDFVVIGSGPWISGFVPAFGEAGDLVTVAGLHLINVKGVSFHGTGSKDFWPNAAGTQITARVPPGATTGVISVTTSSGTTNSVGSFTVIGLAPFISEFVPNSGDTGTKVQVSGRHFTGVNQVRFNGQPGVHLAATSDVFLQVEAPANVTTGPITLSTAQGTGSSSSYFYAKPSLSGFSPGTGRAGSNVVVTGRNLAGTTAVQFNGLASTNFNVVDNSRLRAWVPVGATTGPIRVTAPGGSAFSAANFVVRPTVARFTPISGPAGTPVVVTGANLNAGTPSVRFNGVPAAPATGVGFGQLTCLVPTGATTGRLSVTTVDGSDTNAALFYLPARIDSLAPSNSPPGSCVTLRGQNFSGTASVSFNGTAARSFFVTNNSVLGAIVPEGLSTGPVKVTTPAGTALSAAPFYGPPMITDLRVFLTSSANPVTVGSNLIYTVRLVNGGPNAAPNAAFTNRLPEGVSLVSTYISEPWALARNGDLLVGMANNLNPSSSNVLTVVVVPRTIGSLTNTITVGSDNADPNSGDNTASLVTVVEPVPWLSVRSLAHQVQLSWPVTLSNFALEYRDQLSSSPAWGPVAGPPVISGDQQFVTETNSGSTRFYRLHR